MSSPDPEPLIHMTDVTFRRSGRQIVRPTSWTVLPGEHWAVIGANGSGKTTLMRLASLYEHPSSGRVEVCGEGLGTTDIRQLRRRVAFVSAALNDMLRPTLSAVEVVVCGINAALEPWWHRYTEDDYQRARDCLHDLGLGHRIDDQVMSLSSGERQKMALARTLMGPAEVMILDEPFAGLDYAGREDLLGHVQRLTERPDGPTVVLVTHHLEEICPGITHLLGVAEGAVVADGEIDAVLRDDLLETLFSVPMRIDVENGRRYARMR